MGSDENHVLIDAGISGKRIENGLNSIDLKTEEMQGVLVTHEHIDHISGLGVIARRYAGYDRCYFKYKVSRQNRGIFISCDHAGSAF